MLKRVPYSRSPLLLLLRYWRGTLRALRFRIEIKGSRYSFLAMKFLGCSCPSFTDGLSCAAPIGAGNLISEKGNGETDDEARGRFIYWTQLAGAL